MQTETLAGEQHDTAIRRIRCSLGSIIFLWLFKVKDASSFMNYGQNQNQQLNDQETFLLHSSCEAAEAFSTWTHKLTHTD